MAFAARANLDLNHGFAWLSERMLLFSSFVSVFSFFTFLQPLSSPSTGQAHVEARRGKIWADPNPIALSRSNSIMPRYSEEYCRRRADVGNLALNRG